MKRRAFVTSLVAVSVVVLAPVLPAGAGAGTPSAPTGPAAQAGAAPEPALAPVDFAVLVDQSGSLTPADVDNEKAAVGLVTQSDPSGRSRAMVIGFGSEAPGHSPVEQVCPLTTLDQAGRQQLGSCVQKLRRRGPSEGNDTDFPAAIRQATRRLTEAGRSGVPKLIFLLTDGRLDVQNSPSYGADKASRNANAAGILAEELGRARAARIQVWPLGFGSQPDPAQLRNLAAGGYQVGCVNLPSARPQMRLAKDSAEVRSTAQRAFASARCLGFVAGSQGIPPTDLRVAIPPVATDGAITVVKQDPAVVVRYFDPMGRQVPSSGNFDGSRFQASGQDSPVEALQITDPRPGTWRVNLSPPEGRPKREASISVIWKGVLRSSLTLTPAAPVAGERTVVQMRLQTRRGVVISDPEQLGGISVGIGLTGPSIAEPVRVRLRDDGAAPDERADDGSFAGYLTVPASATGNVDLVGEMVAQGVAGDRRPFPTQILPRPSQVVAKAVLDDHAVHPGGTVRGILSARNNDTSPHVLGLALLDAEALPVSVATASLSVPPGASADLRFTVTYGEQAPLGPSGGRIAVLDRSDSDRELSSTFLTVTVQPAPTWWDRWWWAAVAAAVVAGLAVTALLGLVKARRRRTDSGELELVLQRGDLVVSTLRTGGSSGGWYGFAVLDEASSHPRLERRPAGRYRARRTGDGRVALRTPAGAERLQPGRRDSMPVGDGLQLTVKDLRHERRTARARDGSHLRKARPRTRPGQARIPVRRRGATTAAGTSGEATRPGPEPDTSDEYEDF